MLRIAFVFVTVAVIGSSLSCGRHSTGGGAMHTEDSLATVRQKLTVGEAVLVDVREKDEWDAGHVAGAVFLPLSELSREDGTVAALAAQRLPKEKIVYTHCHLGVRSLTACEILESLGYQVRPLRPGYEDLIAAGLKKADE